MCHKNDNAKFDNPMVSIEIVDNKYCIIFQMEANIGYWNMLFIHQKKDISSLCTTLWNLLCEHFPYF